MIKLSSFKNSDNKIIFPDKEKFAFWDEYPSIQKDMIAVNKIILKHISHVNGIMGQALYDTFAVPGKMLRPAFVMLFSQFNKKAKFKHKQLLNIAASIEMLHNATLIHDDIIDESDMRHGQASIQAKYGKHIAVYAGDYLFAVSLNILSSNTKNISTLQRDSETMEAILLGETEQYNFTYDTNITIEQYLEHIKGKTSVLFGLACLLGSFESGANLKRTLQAKKFGEYLGQVFQIRDDILDYTTSAKDFKKPVLLDVKDGVYSAPLIFALQNDHEQTLHNLVAQGKDLTTTQLQEIDRLVKEHGGITQASSLADQYTLKALEHLQKHWPDTQARQQIESLTHQLLDRKY
ncbi:polyprenyl synthetase family protein [Lactobacillus sp. PV034]|uniref:polyprenyl synthetase family protein n=1 Tax=Lactobacillus sp. PV034 TaxID=2594495 RepID=UPI00223F5789|nr:polyprenyl synthetase family protein [Lactobacillus sp. PV034]QNQ81410.1 polyprenyl synthetase family protein [Lactobacillus sp. PV034]